MSTQIRVTIDEEIYKQLLSLSKDEMRSISNQASVILRNYFVMHPYPAHPLSSPLPYTPTTPVIPTTPTPITITSTAPITPTPTLTYEPEPDNEYYKKVKKYYRTLYGENSKEWQELLTLAAHPNVKQFLKTPHAEEVKYAITDDLNGSLSLYQYEEVLDYLGGRDPDARNI